MTIKEESRQPVVLSRDELYARVWSTPMSQLSVQYGITGTGLAKIRITLSIGLRSDISKSRSRSSSYILVTRRCSVASNILRSFFSSCAVGKHVQP